MIVSPQVPNEHTDTQYLKGNRWAKDPGGQLYTQDKVILSPKVKLLTGQTVTQLWVNLSAYCLVPLVKEGQTLTQMPYPSDRSLKV